MLEELQDLEGELRRAFALAARAHADLLPSAR
jgi:hypothetical protein